MPLQRTIRCGTFAAIMLAFDKRTVLFSAQTKEGLGMDTDEFGHLFRRNPGGFLVKDRCHGFCPGVEEKGEASFLAEQIGSFGLELRPKAPLRSPLASWRM